MPSRKWYVGSRTKSGCHPDDGYLCSSKIVKPMILENITDWVREILIIGSPMYIREMEQKYLSMLDARNDSMSFNQNNADGIFLYTGDNHWARNLNGKPHPQLGRKRPDITGENHPNKRPEVADKIRQSHLGKKHPYQMGDANPMRNPEFAMKLSGSNHWSAKAENKRSCEYCDLTNISKSNYTRWHGNNCKHRR